MSTYHLDLQCNPIFLITVILLAVKQFIGTNQNALKRLMNDNMTTMIYMSVDPHVGSIGE